MVGPAVRFQQHRSCLAGFCDKLCMVLRVLKHCMGTNTLPGQPLGIVIAPGLQHSTVLGIRVQQWHPACLVGKSAALKLSPTGTSGYACECCLAAAAAVCSCALCSRHTRASVKLGVFVLLLQHTMHQLIWQSVMIGAGDWCQTWGTGL